MPSALIVACSATKRRDAGAAIDLYDGNIFRVLRLRRPNIELLIMSGRYGLISACEKIERYDQRLDEKPNLEYLNKLAFQVKAKNLLEYGPLYVCMPLNYIDALYEACRMVYARENGGVSIGYPDWVNACVIYTPPLLGRKGQGFLLTSLVRFCETFPLKGMPKWASCITEDQDESTTKPERTEAKSTS